VARLLLVTGLLPGVLVGAAFASLVSWLNFSALDDSILPVVAAHVARFGFVGALTGLWSARVARRLTGELARLDGADSLAAWARACLRPVLGAHLGAAGAGAILSLHEIEATVQVMPPGDCLARVVLGDLHYLRVAEMSAAGVWLLTLGIAAGLAGGLAFGRVGGDGART
jgi:ABC-type Fe3+ transport system permease subunit